MGIGQRGADKTWRRPSPTQSGRPLLAAPEVMDGIWAHGRPTLPVGTWQLPSAAVLRQKQTAQCATPRRAALRH